MYSPEGELSGEGSGGSTITNDHTGVAPGSAGQGSENQDQKVAADGLESQPGIDNSKWDDDTRKYIEGLRKENARYRTEAKDSRTKLDSLNDRFGKLEGGLKQALGIEEEDIPLEDQVAGLSHVNQELEFKSAIKDIALEVGLRGHDACNYLEYLIQQEADSLEEGEEISEERMSAILQNVQRVHGTSSGSTSFQGEQPKTGGDAGGEITLEEFANMGTLQKGELFGKNPTLYKDLMSKAQLKNLIS